MSTVISRVSDAVSLAVSLAFALLLLGCDTVKYVTSEVTGTAKPEGGIQEVVPSTRTYSTTPEALRRATLAILDEQGYVYEENASSGTIKTEPKTIDEGKTASFIGAYYQAKLFLKLSVTTITYRATFDKKSKLTTQVVQNAEYPEKENSIRKEFFDALDKRLSPASGAQSRVAAPANAPAAVVASEPPKASISLSTPTEAMSIAEMQKILLGLGYRPGPADGAIGRRTVDALKKFQLASKLPATGTLDSDTIRALRRANGGA